jgi:hypothetical protein
VFEGVHVEQRTDRRDLHRDVVDVGPLQRGDHALDPLLGLGIGEDRFAEDVEVELGVLGGPLAQELIGPQDVLFLDKGSRDGVAAGDIFEVRRSASRRRDGATNVPEVMAVLQVVRVGERSATARVLTVTSPDIDRGAESRQIARLPS